jgi:hypothetical protein
MKKITFTILTILATNLMFSQAGEIKNTIKINTIGIFKSLVDIQYEKVLNNKNSVQFGIGIGNYNNHDVDKFQTFHLDNFGSTLNNPINVAITEKTFSLNCDFRHYYMKTTKAPRGLYLSPSIQYLKSNSSYSAYEQASSSNQNGTFDYTKVEYKRDLSIINIRALIGCQLIIANRISLNPYFGPGYAFGSVKGINEKNKTIDTGFVLNYGVYLGVAF